MKVHKASLVNTDDEQKFSQASTTVKRLAPGVDIETDMKTGLFCYCGHGVDADIAEKVSKRIPDTVIRLEGSNDRHGLGGVTWRFEFLNGTKSYEHFDHGAESDFLFFELWGIKKDN